MTTKEMAYEYRLSQWSKLAKKRGELGLSIRAYCSKKGFAKSTYFYWQRRLREVTRTHLSSEQASLAGSCFTKVTLAPAPETPVTQAQAGQLQVELKGSHLSVDSSYPPEKLAALLRELSASC